MQTRTSILASILIAILSLSVGFYCLARYLNQEARQITIATDSPAYQSADIIRVSIRNQGNHSVDIYCQQFCALGNFPTAVEKYANGQWQYALGFCPSIEPLFGSRVVKGNYILHTLSAGDTFELDLENLESLRLEQVEKFRIVYYVGIIRKPVYSNEFTIGP